MSKFNLTLDASQIYAFKTCPLSWYYRYVKNLRLDGTQMVAADKGTLVHNILDLYYNIRTLDNSGNKLSQASAAIELFYKSAITKTLFPSDDGTLDKFICDRFLLYVQRWINDDFNVPVGGVETGFSFLLHETDEVRFILEGRIDLLNSIQGLNCFTDHKTQERTVNLYHFTPQFKTYALVTGYQYGMVNYFGMQQDKNNELLKNNKLFRRDLINFPARMIFDWRVTCIETFWKIKSLLDSNDPEAVIWAERNEASCAGAFQSNPCQFTHICEETNWDMKERVKEFKYKVVERWSPW